jgi:hypothetical protein
MTNLIFTNQEQLNEMRNDLAFGNLTPAIGTKSSLIPPADPNTIHPQTTWIDTGETETYSGITYKIWLRIA